MSRVAERAFGQHIILHPVRAVVVALVLLGAATALVGLGRWTAPAATNRVSTVAPLAEGCGTISPKAMPLPGCRQLLTNMYLGTGMPCGTIMPGTMPSQECQRVLERFFLGTRKGPRVCIRTYSHKVTTLLGTHAALDRCGSTLVATLSLAGDALATSRPTPTEARSVAVEFFRSQNERRYGDTCRLLSRGFYETHRLRDQRTCGAVLRVAFVWSGKIEFRIGKAVREGDSFVVHAVADGAPGRIVLVREDGSVKILAVAGS